MEITVLAVAAWDIRTSVEAQIRSLTALQRAIDAYRDEGRGEDMLESIAQHLSAVERQHVDIGAALPMARESLSRLQVDHTRNRATQ